MNNDSCVSNRYMGLVFVTLIPNKHITCKQYYFDIILSIINVVCRFANEKGNVCLDEQGR